MYTGIHISTRYSFRILMKLEYFRQICEKFSNIKFHENPSSGSQTIPRQTDLTKLLAVFAIFGMHLKINQHKKITLHACFHPVVSQNPTVTICTINLLYFIG
jgi:hypothetical protein